MKKRKSKALDFKKEIISDLKKIKGGLLPFKTGDTALCMSTDTFC
ncbi:hypothetical protein [Kordia sp.]|nr:hypothetical protein [Kordia sp.]